MREVQKGYKIQIASRFRYTRKGGQFSHFGTFYLIQNLYQMFVILLLASTLFFVPYTVLSTIRVISVGTFDTIFDEIDF